VIYKFLFFPPYLSNSITTGHNEMQISILATLLGFVEERTRRNDKCCAHIL